jgi:glucose-1-phosphate cytidylyltransferase
MEHRPMKVVILAGGYGTRISEESQIRPKPLVEIGGRPIIWHIMKLYAHFGLTNFIVCCGYKAEMLKQYFRDLFDLSGDVTFDFVRGESIHLRPEREPWRVTLVDTGLATMTGGRLRRVRHLLSDTFCLAYGDGVSDVPLDELVAFHRNGGLLATVTAISLPSRFGTLQINSSDHVVDGFREKSPQDGVLINGGFFVLEPPVIDLIEGDTTVWEQEPMKQLVAARQLQAYQHRGYWQNMDTLRDKQVLDDLWKSGNAPWKIWDRPSQRRAPAQYAALAKRRA